MELYLSMKLCISCKQMNQFCYYHDGISSLFSFILLVFYFVKFVMYTCQQFSQIYISVITVLNLVCLLVLFRFSFKLYRLHFVGDCLICFQILKRAIQYRTVRYILYVRYRTGRLLQCSSNITPLHNCTNGCGCVYCRNSQNNTKKLINYHY